MQSYISPQQQRSLANITVEPQEKDIELKPCEFKIASILYLYL